MAVLPIITAPDKRLKVKSEPVEHVDAYLAALMDDMLETMYLAPGVGLAAPQVGVTKRIIVIDVGKSEEERARSSSLLPTSMTIMRLVTPTCGAARPTPGARYIVSSMSSINAARYASTCSTGSDLTFRRLSGAVMMGRTAMGKLSQIC